MEKCTEKCTSCGRYFWKSPLAPTDFFHLKQKYCPRCFPDVLEEHSKLYNGYEHYF
jgi:hypothetical protein